jgi:uncharacterized protein (DUF305 family)
MNTQVRDSRTGVEEPIDPDEPIGPDDDQQLAPAPAPRRSFGVGVLALAVVVSLLLGLAVAIVFLRPDEPPGDTSAEAGFARDMITHHDQAVTMGMIAFQHAEDPEVRQLGYDIAMLQQGEIGMMHQWLLDWELSPTGSQPRMAWMDAAMTEGGLMPGMATPDQLTELREAEGSEVDRLFLELMTYHHLGGIHMIDGVLDRTDNDDVIWLAELMRTGQQKELQVMQDLQDELGF